MKDRPHDHRKKSSQGKAEQGGAKCQHDEGSQSFAISNKSDPFLHAFQNGRLCLGRAKLHLDHEERDDHRDIRDAVQRETPGRPEDGIREAAESRADNACKIELNRIHRNRIGKIFRSHKRWQQCRIGGSAK